MKTILNIVLIIFCFSIVNAQSNDWQRTKTNLGNISKIKAVSSNLAYMLGEENILQKTSDAGNTFINMPAPDGKLIVDFDVNQNGNIIAEAYNGSSGSEIYMFSSGVWVKSQGLPEPIDLIGVSISPDGNIVYTASTKIVFKSTNFGSTWIATDLSGMLSSSKTIYKIAAFNSGVFTFALNSYPEYTIAYKSSDGITGWTAVKTWNGTINNSSARLDRVSVSETDKVFAIVRTQYTTIDMSIWYSQSGGAWAQLPNLPPTDNAYPGYMDINENSQGIYIAHANLHNSPSLYSGIYKSTSNGQAWSLIRTDPYNYTSIVCKGNKILASRSYMPGFVSSADNGVSWNERSDGISSYSTPLLSSAGNKIYADNVFYSNDKGLSWKKMNTPVDNYSRVSVSNFNGRSWIGTNSLFYYTDNDGLTWNSILTPSSFYAAFQVPVLVNVSSQVSFMLQKGDSRLYRTTNGGSNWDQMTNGLAENSFLSLTSVQAGSSLTLLAGTYDNGVYRSTDNGESWQQANYGLYATQIFALKLSPANNVYAATKDAGLFKSTNAGVSWQRIYQPSLSNSNVNDIAIRSDNEIYISISLSNNSKGVLRTTDGGTSWQQFGASFSNSYVTSLAVINDGNVFATKKDSGVFRYGDASTGVTMTGTGIPDKYSLSQNYPNPFNPTTKIKYSIPVPGFTTLKVYDISGKEISTLISEKQNAGEYETVFNAKDLASGIYFYTLSSSDFTSTGKMILLK